MDKTTITINTYNKCAKLFMDKFMEITLEREILISFANLIKPNSKILDLGCGPGNIICFLLDMNKNYSVDAIDLSFEMLNLVQYNAPRARCFLGDIRNLEMIIEEYDAIIASFIIVHLADDETEKLFKNIAKLLKPNGVLYISFIEGIKKGFEVTSFSSGDQLFYNYFEEMFLRNLLEENRIIVLDIHRHKYIKSKDGTSIIHVYMICKKY